MEIAATYRQPSQPMKGFLLICSIIAAVGGAVLAIVKAAPVLWRWLKAFAALPLATEKFVHSIPLLINLTNELKPDSGSSFMDVITDNQKVMSRQVSEVKEQGIVAARAAQRAVEVSEKKAEVLEALGDTMLKVLDTMETLQKQMKHVLDTYVPREEHELRWAAEKAAAEAREASDVRVREHMQDMAMYVQQANQAGKKHGETT